jgi:MoaA/NifB/PqqE/SkfB family radical SAM enzyme
MDRKRILKLKNNSGFSSILDLISFYQKKSPSKYFYKPVGVEVEITNNCNLKCSACPIVWDLKKVEDTLKTDDYVRFLKDCSHQGIFAYSLTGGETFLKFKTIIDILKANHNLDLYKLNTNGSFFSSPSLTEKYFIELKKNGFSSKNKYIKPVLVVSLGQQTVAGVPLNNIINTVFEFIKIFKNEAYLSLNITDSNFALAQKIYCDLKQAYFKKTKNNFPENMVKTRFFSLNHFPTLKRLGLLTGRKISINSLLNMFSQNHLSSGCFNISHASHIFSHSAETLIPRCLLRPNGQIYSCPGFNLTHLLGNITKDSLKDILYKANQNIVLKEIYLHNLKGLFKLASKFEIELKKLQLDEVFEPCDLCQLLTKKINQHYEPKQ